MNEQDPIPLARIVEPDRPWRPPTVTATCPAKGRLARSRWWLDCDREPGHPGAHWDGVDEVWWEVAA